MKCEKCNGKYVTTTTKTYNDRTIRYKKCEHCGNRIKTIEMNINQSLSIKFENVCKDLQQLVEKYTSENGV